NLPFPSSIFTSPEQPSTPVQGVPQVPSTGGSLPDLSSLHFPSPLPTPLDQDEPSYPGPSTLSGGSSTGNLASTLTQLGINAAGGNGSYHHPSPGSNPSYSSGVGMAGSGSSPYTVMLAGQGQPSLSTSPRRRVQLSPLILPMVGESWRHHSKQFSPTISPTLSSISQPQRLMGTQPNMPVKSESALEPCTQTSSLCQVKLDMEQQVEQQRGGGLPQQQQINLNTDFYNDALFSSLLEDPYLSLQLSGKSNQQAGELRGPCEEVRPSSDSCYRAADMLPVAVNLLQCCTFTSGGRDSPTGLSKEIASALSHVPGFEMDPFSLDEQLRMDPLSLDMLEGDLMLADPAVEDSFRSDRLK
ncbi:hypothetical protein GOODEAATRI_022863, partial [Goodea atripinnis]